MFPLVLLICLHWPVIGVCAQQWNICSQSYICQNAYNLHYSHLTLYALEIKSSNFVFAETFMLEDYLLSGIYFCMSLPRDTLSGSIYWMEITSSIYKCYPASYCWKCSRACRCYYVCHERQACKCFILSALRSNYYTWLSNPVSQIITPYSINLM